LRVSRAGRMPSRASEQGFTLFANGEFIGRREKESQAFDLRKLCWNGWLTLRDLGLKCCFGRPGFDSSLSKIVLPDSPNGRHLLAFSLGKVVLLTAAWLPSDKTPAPSSHAAFLSISPVIPLRYLSSQQQQNPLRRSCVFQPLPIAKCHRHSTSASHLNRSTFLIAEGSGYQVKIPQTAFCRRVFKAVSG
jgi:hypothetical protein